MITGWRHNDLQKSDKNFREEVQKEFERLYNLDGRGDAFDKAVKDAIGRLLDPKNPKGWGTNGIPGANGIGGQGSGRNGSDGGNGNGDGKDGSGRNGRDGRNGGNNNGNGGFDEQLTQFDVIKKWETPKIEKTSGVSTLVALTGAGGSGLMWFKTGNSQGYYQPSNANAIAHALTSSWHRYPAENLNESRLMPSSYKFADWTTPQNIVVAFPDAIDTDNSLKKPYFISDIAADAWGHVSKVKISNLRDWFVGNPPTDPPEDILEPLRIVNVIQNRNGVDYGGLAWYDKTTFELIPDIADTTNGKYNGSVERIIGHGETSDWTTGRTGKPYNPSKNHYMANHHFYRGDWDNPTRIGNDDNGAINGVPVGEPINPARYSVVVDLNADSYGHIQYAYTQEIQRLYAGRGLFYDNGAWLGSSFDWYHSAKERTVEHPQTLSAPFLISPFSFAGGVFDGAVQDAFGQPTWRNTGGTTIQTVDSISYISPRVPTAFWTNDSGHLEAIGWSDLPLIRGPKGDKGDAAIVSAYVASTNTLPPGSFASASVVNVGTSSNANFGFSFNIPQGAQGPQGPPGLNGANGTPATVAAFAQLVGTGGPSVNVVNLGTTQNAVWRFDFEIPAGGGGGGGTVNNYYNTSVENIGFYGEWRSLVYNPGNNNPIYIKRVGTEGPLSPLGVFEVGDTVMFFHKVPVPLPSNQYNWTPGLGVNAAAINIEPEDNGDGTWSFPAFAFNSTGHLVTAYRYNVPIGGGGGGGGGSAYTWNAATATGTSVVNNNNTVRFLSSDTNKMTITQVGQDITFDVKQSAFQLQPLVAGNGISDSPNGVAPAGFQYDPYTGTTFHVNNNTKTLAGIVKKGSDPSNLALTTKVWGTNNLDDPDWRPVVRLKGSRYISLIEESPGVYAITLVN